MLGTFYAGHPLLGDVTNLWLPALSAARGQIYPTWQSGTGVRRASAPGKLVGNPIWRNTPFGDGVQTDDLKYVDVSPSPGGRLQISTPSTVAVAYLYRYDASGAQETGILLSCGNGGLSFRHNGTTLEALRSHAASLGTGTTAASSRDQFRTAIVTFSGGATATMTLYFDGRQVGTGSNSTLMTGATTACLGYDQSASTPEFGRHTILGAGLWEGVTWSAQKAWDWHQVARRQFVDFFLSTPAFAGSGAAIGASDFLPQSSKPARVEPEPAPIPPRPSPLAFLLSAGVVGGGDWLPFMGQRAAIVQPATPGAPGARRVFSWLFDPNVRPPGGLTKAKARPFLHRIPKVSGESGEQREARVRRFADNLSSAWNSWVRQGILVQVPVPGSPTGADGYQIRPSAHVDARDPGAMDDVTEDYPIGCSWVNSVTKKVWFCTDNTIGAATWSGPF